MYWPICASDLLASGTTLVATWKTCIWPGQILISTGTPCSARRFPSKRAS
ncbi:Uncharacterised protein [Mycobacteroides abscessus subsp. abscessus]|nr:Uncharacterised protein [Mycobacteroides abscessus subsp. abscessus]